jgi:hypothetical protein
MTLSLPTWSIAWSIVRAFILLGALAPRNLRLDFSYPGVMLADGAFAQADAIGHAARK